MDRRIYPMLWTCLPLLGACAPTALSPVSFSIQYQRMADSADIPVVQPCAALAEVSVVDGRIDKSTGKRFLEKNETVVQPVTITANPVGWVNDGVRDGLQRARVELGRSDHPVLRLTLEEISAEESVYVNAEYDGRVVMTAEVLSAGSSQPCWTARVEGFAENYGNAGSIVNYAETMNHALDRAVIKLVGMEGFSESICGQCG